jgi:protein required for attachment to host cells
MPMTWTLVADRTRARLFSSARAAEPLVELRDFLNPDGRELAQELVTDRASRMPGMVGRARGALEARTSPEDHAADVFARGICATIERGLMDRNCNRLVLIAAPEFLGRLHGCASKRVLDAIAFELGKNLTALSPEDIRPYLPVQIWSELAG